MDRRSFLTSMLLAVGVIAASAGAANALPAFPTHDDLAPEGDVEKTWWYWRRRRWYRWRRRRWWGWRRRRWWGWRRRRWGWRRRYW